MIPILVLKKIKGDNEAAAHGTTLSGSAGDSTSNFDLFSQVSVKHFFCVFIRLFQCFIPLNKKKKSG